MPKRPPGLHRHGTAGQLAEYDQGYAKDGTGEWSRHAAHSSTPDLSLKQHSTTTKVENEQIRTERDQLGELIQKADKLAPGRTLENVLKSIGIKEKFLARLMQRAG
jgi:hypothetical protein